MCIYCKRKQVIHIDTLNRLEVNSLEGGYVCTGQMHSVIHTCLQILSGYYCINIITIKNNIKRVSKTNDNNNNNK